MFGLVLASTGLARMMPAGPVTGGAWQVREYHRRGAGTGPGMWAVLAGGFTSTVVIVALLLAGAAAAGLGPIPLLACAAGLSRRRGPGWAAGVLACTAAGLLAAAGNAGRLFQAGRAPGPLAGPAVRLRRRAAGRAARLAARRIGGVEGGMLGALTLTGTPPAAAAAAVIVYRVAGCWAVGAAGPRWQAPSPAAPRGVPGRDASRQPADGPPP